MRPLAILLRIFFQAQKRSSKPGDHPRDYKPSEHILFHRIFLSFVFLFRNSRAENFLVSYSDSDTPRSSPGPTISFSQNTHRARHTVAWVNQNRPIPKNGEHCFKKKIFDPTRWEKLFQKKNLPGGKHPQPSVASVNR